MPIGGGRIVSPDAAERTRRVELGRAARAGQLVAALITVLDPRRGYRSAWIDGSHYSYRLDPPVTDVQLVIGDRGVDPAVMLDRVKAGGWDGAVSRYADEALFGGSR